MKKLLLTLVLFLSVAMSANALSRVTITSDPEHPTPTAVNAGSDYDLGFIVTNNSTVYPLQITTANLTAAGLTVKNDDCNSEIIQPGKTCEIELDFEPTLPSNVDQQAFNHAFNVYYGSSEFSTYTIKTSVIRDTSFKPTIDIKTDDGATLTSPSSFTVKLQTDGQTKYTFNDVTFGKSEQQQLIAPGTYDLSVTPSTAEANGDTYFAKLQPETVSSTNSTLTVDFDKQSAKTGIVDLKFKNLPDELKSDKTGTTITLINKSSTHQQIAHDVTWTTTTYDDAVPVGNYDVKATTYTLSNGDVCSIPSDQQLSVADGANTLSLSYTCASQSSYNILINETSTWDGGAVANLSVTNNSGTSLPSGWILQITLPEITSVDSSWGQDATATFAGGKLTVTGTDDIKNQASISEGMSLSTSADLPVSAKGSLNGIPVTVKIDRAPAPGPTPTGDDILIKDVDQEGQTPVNDFLVTDDQSHTYTLENKDGKSLTYTVKTNNPNQVTATVSDDNQLTVTRGVNCAKADGGCRAGLLIIDSDKHKRQVGVDFSDVDNKWPGLPKKYLSVGVVSEDSTADLGMWGDGYKNDNTNHYANNRYIYLNGGPINGWYTWSGVPGGRAITYIQNSQKLGMVPTFVWYNIPGGGESCITDLQDASNPTYMTAYYKLLGEFIDIVKKYSDGQPVMLIMEPDFLGYMMQGNCLKGNQSADPNSTTITDSYDKTYQIQTATAYSEGILTKGTDPDFPNTLNGLVSSINYIIRRDLPEAIFGWQINVWANPAGNTEGCKSATDSLMKSTDDTNCSFTKAREGITGNAEGVATYYQSAGIASAGGLTSPNFISFDKYGLDSVAVANTDGSSPVTNPELNPWFFNADQWNNYLLYVSKLHEEIGLPVVLWQLPVGHINNSQAISPYTSKAYNMLNNTTNKYEDSTTSYFFGDSFDASKSYAKGGASVIDTPNRLTYFSENLAADSSVTKTGNVISWGAHMQAAENAGVINVMFGDGVGISTKDRPTQAGQPSPDEYYLMSRIQEYLKNPVPLSMDRKLKTRAVKKKK